MKYMVMECRPGYAVVMDNEGRFTKVANRHYEVGQLLSEVTPMQVSRHKPTKWLYSLAAVAACLVLLLTTVLPLSPAPYASVYVKINPEVRIDVDKHDRVVGLEGINADGIALAEGYDYHRKDLKLVTDELVDLAITAGYLQSDGQITLTLDSTDELWVTDHSQTLSDHMHQHLQDRFTVTIEVSLHHGDQPTEHSADHRTEHHTQAPPQTTPPETVPEATRVIVDWNDDDDDDDDDRDDDDDDDDDDRHHGRDDHDDHHDKDDD